MVVLNKLPLSFYKGHESMRNCQIPVRSLLETCAPVCVEMTKRKLNSKLTISFI